MATYLVEYRLEGAYDSRTFTADTDQDARRLGRSAAVEWAVDGDWPPEGGLVDVGVTITREGADEDDDPIYDRVIEVEIPCDEEELIRNAGADSSCDHDLREIDGSIRSLGGTTLSGWEECRTCGLLKRWQSLGSQRNPGESDSVQFFANREDAAEAGYYP